MHRLEIDILRDRVSAALAGRSIELRRMFGGETFMINGNMLCCISKAGLMARVGADAETEALERPFAARCLGSGREMPGFLIVPHVAVERDEDLRSWLDLALAYVERLPPKEKKARRATAGHKAGRKAPTKGR